MLCRVGGEKVLLVGVALWSLGTFLAPSAAHIGFLTLCASRVLVHLTVQKVRSSVLDGQVGLAEGLAPSAATCVLSKQVPTSERSRAVSAVFGGLDLGCTCLLRQCLM